MIYGCQIKKGVYFCSDYLKIFIGCHFITLFLNYTDSNQDPNIQQERMNTQKNRTFHFT